MRILVTKQEVAELYGTTTRKIDRLTMDGKLHRMKLGKVNRDAIRDNRPTRYRLDEVLSLIGMSVSEYRTLQGADK